jgi:hypothetical protein
MGETLTGSGVIDFSGFFPDASILGKIQKVCFPKGFLVTIVLLQNKVS